MSDPALAALAEMELGLREHFGDGPDVTYPTIDALRAVLGIHRPTDDTDTAPFQSCEACAHDWPCPTVAAIAKHIGGSG